MNIRKLLESGLARYFIEHKGSAAKAPRATSKHAGAKRKPRNWYQKKRKSRKAQKIARHRNR